MMQFATDAELVWPTLMEKVNGKDLFASGQNPDEQ